MKSINFKDIELLDSTYHSFGTYARIYKCLYKNILYAYKSFNDDDFFKGKKNKLNAISKIQSPYLYTPLYWVKSDFISNNYLIKFCFGKDLNAFSDYEILHKIKVLKNAKKAILNMHDNGIIHADLIGSNIMIENDEARIIDFDNSSFDRFKTNTKEINDLSCEFIEKYGIIPEVDIYTFNLITFSIINQCYFHSVRQHIQNKEYQYIDDKDAIDILKHMSFDKTTPIKDFLIDAIDESKFKI